MLLLIDESAMAIQHKEYCYVIAAGVVLAEGADAVRTAAKTAIDFGGSRKRPFHWTSEGSVTKQKMLDVATVHTEAVLVASALKVPEKRQEQARQLALRMVLEQASAFEITEIVIESREKSCNNEGDNKKDYSTLIEARHAHVLSPKVHYEWRNKYEPLLWLPDAVAASVGIEHLGVGTPLDQIRGVGKLVEVSFDL